MFKATQELQLQDIQLQKLSTAQYFADLGILLKHQILKLPVYLLCIPFGSTNISV